MARGDAVLAFHCRICGRSFRREPEASGQPFSYSFHNGVSQWLFPKFLAGGEETWLGEGALLPLACYAVAAIALSGVFRRQGPG